MPRAGCRIRLAVLIALACVPTLAAAAEISGTALYRERMALPANAVFEATLEDVTRADAPATIVGQARIVRPPAPPIEFRIPFDRADIDARHRYVVRARITVDGRAMFVTEQAPRVLERGVDHNVALALIRATRDEPSPRVFTRLPAEFAGMLPCRDCAGMRQVLRLLPGNGFHLANTQLRSGQDVTTWERGTWTLSSDGRVLQLNGERGKPLRYQVRDAATLRALDDDGNPRSSEPANDLKRSDAPARIEPRGRMRGMYRYQADAGWFVDCATGQRLAVVQEADNAALERAYGRDRSAPGEELQVTVEGRITTRPRIEGIGQEPALIVERFVESRAGERCGTGLVTSSLEATRWVPTRLWNEAVTIAPGTREPYVTFDGTSGRMTGFGGCNRFSGTFKRSGDSLRLGPAASTRMACPSGAFSEQGFFDALQAARSWRVLGTGLELYDESGAIAARFEARDL